MKKLSILGVFFGLVGGCNVSTTDNGTGPAQSEHGIIAILSDWRAGATQVALLSPQGNPESESFLSTASIPASETSFPLSSDVAVPSSAPLSGEVVLLDRFGKNVITWANPKTAAVRAQLQVGTGFESNPQDYAEVSSSKAYVSRWGLNEHPGEKPLDAGNDLLVLDPSVPSILKSISIPVTGSTPPRPAGITRVGNYLLVTLQHISADFASAEAGEIAVVDTRSDEVTSVFTLSGLTNCGTVALAPSKAELAVACAGVLDFNGSVKNLDESGVVFLNFKDGSLSENRRFSAPALFQSALQNSLVFASDKQVLVKTQSPLKGSTNNQLIAVNLHNSSTEVLSEARADAGGIGKGLVYGGLICTRASLCLLADQDRGVFQRYSLQNDKWVAMDPLTITTEAGLPPVGLSTY